MKYDRFANAYPYPDRLTETMRDLLAEGEQILWSGKPKKSAYVAENVCGALLPFVLLWLLIDGAFITLLVTQIGSALPRVMIPILCVAFALHLTPVWIWLYKILTAGKRQSNTEYCLTDRRVILRTGLFSVGVYSVPLTEIVTVELHVGFTDRLCGVGDVILRTAALRNPTFSNTVIDVERPAEVLRIISDAVEAAK